jgi:hypothetical protein
VRQPLSWSLYVTRGYAAVHFSRLKLPRLYPGDEGRNSRFATEVVGGLDRNRRTGPMMKLQAHAAVYPRFSPLLRFFLDGNIDFSSQKAYSSAVKAGES